VWPGRVFKQAPVGRPREEVQSFVELCCLVALLCVLVHRRGLVEQVGQANIYCVVLGLQSLFFTELCFKCRHKHRAVL
jgi:hypothetical protein